MGIKTYKPTTPSRRYITTPDYSGLSKTKPPRPLRKKIKKTSGRNNRGRITAWQRGGGHKRIYRKVDFRRDKEGIPGTVKTIEYDPNRTAFIALIAYRDGERRYILAPEGLSVGDTVISGPGSPVKPGNTMPLREIPEGFPIHNMEMIPGRGGQIVRSAGTSATILSKEETRVHVQLPSGEVRIFDGRCVATVGTVSNPDHEKMVIGKAGRVRHMGRRPNVRGVAMNPVDHPHGGGEGRNKGKVPKTPWGKTTRGAKTRRGKKASDRFIVKRRK
jgi:large subunit ribosomal protein L2